MRKRISKWDLIKENPSNLLCRVIRKGKFYKFYLINRAYN